jgi:hypothetical protein
VILIGLLRLDNLRNLWVERRMKELERLYLYGWWWWEWRGVFFLAPKV